MQENAARNGLMVNGAANPLLFLHSSTIWQLCNLSTCESFGVERSLRDCAVRRPRAAESARGLRTGMLDSLQNLRLEGFV